MSFSLTFEEDAQFAQIRQDAAVCCCQLSLVGPSQFGENDKTTTTVRDGGAAPRLSGPVACEVFFLPPSQSSSSSVPYYSDVYFFV
jgi:hypothetical protein